MSITYDTSKSAFRNLIDAVIASANAEEAFLNDLLFVDGDRSDDYTEDGSIAHPFKTIAAAKTASVSGDIIVVAPGTYAEVVSLTGGTSLFAFNMAGATITGEVLNFKGSTIEFTGDLVMENAEVIKNDTDGQIDITGALVVSSTLEVNGDITLENDEVIKNDTDGQIDITGNLVISGTGQVGGDITLENGEKISNVTDGQVDVDGNFDIAPGTTGGLITKIAEATATLSGASTTIQVNVPTGSLLLGVQLRVDTLITSGDGATSWDAAYSGGATQAITTGQAFTKQTKVNKFFDANGATAIASGETDIAITPDSNTFSGGVVRAIVYYQAFDAMADAA